MPLDRTWYNTLVDDDGSNTVGSVWNKASVDHIYDDVDASLPAWVGYSPVWRNAASASVPTQNSCRYWRTGNVLFLSVYTVGLFFGQASPWLSIALPFPPLAPLIESFPLRLHVAGAAAGEQCFLRTQDGPQALIYRMSGVPFQEFANFDLFGQGFYLL